VDNDSTNNTKEESSKQRRSARLSQPPLHLRDYVITVVPDSLEEETSVSLQEEIDAHEIGEENAKSTRVLIDDSVFDDSMLIDDNETPEIVVAEEIVVVPEIVAEEIVVVPEIVAEESWLLRKSWWLRKLWWIRKSW